MRLHALAALIVAAVAVPVHADTTSFAASAEVRAQIVAMERAMKPGQGFAWQPLVQADGSVAALEYWKAAGRPAVHPAEAEYAIVMEGAGALLSGGTLVAPQTKSAGLIDGDRIDGGTTRSLAPGDVFLVPAGVPHWFRVDGRLVLLGIKIRTGNAASSAIAK